MTEENDAPGFFSRDEPAGDLHTILRLKEDSFILKPDDMWGCADVAVREIDETGLECKKKGSETDIDKEGKEDNRADYAPDLLSSYD